MFFLLARAFLETDWANLQARAGSSRIDGRRSKDRGNPIASDRKKEKGSQSWLNSSR